MRMTEEKRPKRDRGRVRVTHRPFEHISVAVSRRPCNQSPRIGPPLGDIGHCDTLTVRRFRPELGGWPSRCLDDSPEGFGAIPSLEVKSARDRSSNPHGGRGEWVWVWEPRGPEQGVGPEAGGGGGGRGSSPHCEAGEMPKSYSSPIENCQNQVLGKQLTFLDISVVEKEMRGQSINPAIP